MWRDDKNNQVKESSQPKREEQRDRDEMSNMIRKEWREDEQQSRRILLKEESGNQSGVKQESGSPS